MSNLRLAIPNRAAIPSERRTDAHAWDALRAAFDAGRGGRHERRIGYETRVRPTSKHAGYAVVHYGTTICEAYPDGKVWIGTRGWGTRTTMHRLNLLLRAFGADGVRACTEKGAAMIETNAGVHAASSGVVLHIGPHGTEDLTA